MAKTSGNKNLHKASKAKKDEFYTQLVDIEKELKHYKEQFKNKVVYCNCDDPFESNFFKYFVLNFNQLGLKKLITTSYKPSPVANVQLGLFGDDKTLTQKRGRPKVTANKFIINKVEDLDKSGSFDLNDIVLKLKANKNNEWEPLEEDGDFRSEESIELLKQADIVVTNPPFSLFREYVAQLVEYDKKFLIIGNMNAVTYKEIFKLIKNNEMWLGYSPRGMNFFVPEGDLKNVNATWFTNLTVSKRSDILSLYKKYNKDEYPKYDNYDAIEVSKTSDIPLDYNGVIGVPITFLDKFNPEQFEIVARADANIANENNKYHIKGFSDKGGAPMINGNFIYKRILIKNRKIKKYDMGGNF